MIQMMLFYTNAFTYFTEKRLRQIPNPVLVRTIKKGLPSGDPRKAAERPGKAKLPELLELGSAGHPEGSTRYCQYQGAQQQNFYY